MSHFKTWQDETIGDWSLGFVTSDCFFYCNFKESDTNANTKMYDNKLNLISDNYFAYEALEEELDKIRRHETKVFFASPKIMQEICRRETEEQEETNQDNNTEYDTGKDLALSV